MKRVIILLTLIINFLTAVSQELNSPLPVDDKVKTGILPNGMRYYIRKNLKPEHRAEFRLAVNVGSTSEDDDQQGFAHLTEHMAFNGTEHFKKNELIDYLESVGTKFGAHLNAYTSFDETVYMIQLPTDTPEIVNKGLQILGDWAHGLAFDSAEIDKERGVVIEEWRLGQGANERMRRKYWPLLFKDSRYAVRLPIGKKEIIEHSPQSALKRFYADWYRPDLMAIVAVGDFNVADIEAKIKKTFSEIPRKQQRRTLQSYMVPDNDSLIIGTATDVEARRANVQLIYKQPREIQKTVSDYVNGLAENLFTSMLNARLNELERLADPPFFSAGSNYGPFVRTLDAYTCSAAASGDSIERALLTLVRENERVRRFGFSQSELDRQKTDILRSYDILYNEREKTESANYTREYVSNFLTGEPIPGIEYEYNIARKFINGITLEQVNAFASKWITDGRNCIVIITAPDKPSTVLPSDERIRQIISSMKSMQIEKYEDAFVDKPLIPSIAEGSKINYEKVIKELNITEWGMPNGVKVIVKPTDFKNDEVLFSSYSWGGWSVYDRSDFRSASFADEIIDASGLGEFDPNALTKKLTGKAVSCSPYIGELQQGLSGSCSPADLETLMQLIYGYHMYPRKDSIAFMSWLIKQRTALKNRNADPLTVFNDTVAYIMSSYNYHFQPPADSMLDELNLDRAYTIYKERFNAATPVFFFVGTFNMDSLKALVEKYLGALPVIRVAGKWSDIGANPPPGLIEKTVRMGQEPRSTVMMRFNMPFDFNRNNRNEVNVLAKLMNIRLREVLREEKSGVYHVSFISSPSHYPQPELEQIIYFSCDPHNVEMLIQAAKDVIREVKEKGCDEKNLLKIRETAIRERETYLKENKFWLNSLSSNYENGENILDLLTYNKWVNSLKGSDFIGFANKYLQEQNYAKFVLAPKAE